MNDSDTPPQPETAADTPVQPDAAPAAPKASTSLDRELAEMKDRLLRTLAEMENMRKRTDREVADARVYGISTFATSWAWPTTCIARACRRSTTSSATMRTMP